jgi:hypothetical protein
LLDEKRRRNASSSYEMRNGLLYKADALVVPKDAALRAELLRIHYDDPMSGHFGPAKTIALLARKYFWPEIGADVKEHIRTCGVCQRTHTQRHRPYGELQSLPIPNGPF